MYLRRTLAALFVLVLLALGGCYLDGADVAPDGTIALAWETRLYLTDRQASRLDEIAEPGLFPHWSPDGGELAFVSWDERRTTLNVYRRGDGAVRTIAEAPRQGGDSGDPFRIYFPRWSPDGRWISYLVADDETETLALHLVGPDGAGERTLLEDAGLPAAWSPDGARLAAVAFSEGRAHLVLVEAPGGGITKAAQLYHEEEFYANWPEWSTSGGFITFIARALTLPRPAGEETPDEAVFAYRPGGAALERLTPPGRRVSYQRLSPGGGKLLYVLRGPRAITGPGELWVRSTAGGEARRVAPEVDLSLLPFWYSEEEVGFCPEGGELTLAHLATGELWPLAEMLRRKFPGLAPKKDDGGAQSK